MNAFYQAIERIDEIKVDDALRAPLIGVFEKWAKYIDEHPNIKIDFDKLFKNYLYNNLVIEKVDEIIIDEQDVAGVYRTGKNEIQVSNITNMLEHTLMHEFTHFVYHNTYKDLPTWADEMMTESFTIDMMGVNMGSYVKLTNFFNLLDKNVEKIDFEQFLNGNFADYMKENNLNDINSQLASLLETTTQDQYDDIMTTLVLKRASNLLSKDLTFQDYITKMMETDLRGLVFSGKLYVDRLTYSAIQYVNKVRYTSTDFMQVRSIIENMCIIDRVEKELNDKLESLQTGELNGVPFLLGVSGKQAIFWYDFPSYQNMSIEKGRFAKIEFKGNGFSACNSPAPDGRTAFEVMGHKFVWDEKTREFRCEGGSKIELKPHAGTMQANIQALANLFNLAIYNADKQNFVTKPDTARARAFNNDKNFDEKMHDLTRLATALRAPLYACKQSLYTSGNEDTGMIILSPLYGKHDESTVLTKMDGVSKENILSVLKGQNVQFGEQFDIVAKINDKYVTIANVCKGNERDGANFGVSVNYNVALKQLAPVYADAILSEFVPIEKSNLIKVDECFVDKNEKVLN